jgi:hypothetical protein
MVGNYKKKRINISWNQSSQMALTVAYFQPFWF